LWLRLTNVRVPDSVVAAATIVHYHDRSSLFVGGAPLSTDAEDTDEQDNDDDWNSKAKHQTEHQAQLWTVVDIAHIAEILDKVS